jgi:hypothetical protein
MSFKELCQQLRRLDFHPPVHVTVSDFAAITQDGSLCNQNGEMTPRDFELAMRLQLKLFVQVCLNNSIVMITVLLVTVGMQVLSRSYCVCA